MSVSNFYGVRKVRAWRSLVADSLWAADGVLEKIRLLGMFVRIFAAKPLGRTAPPISYVMRSGGRRFRVAFPTVSEMYLVGTIMRRGEYAVPIGEVKRIIDLGANIGIASLYFLSTYPDAHIDAYEIDPDTVPFLNKNLKAFPAASVHNLGVAAEAGEFDLYRLPTGASSASSLIPAQGMQKGPRIRTESLDSLIGDDIVDILKIDVEGSEYEILKASTKLSQVRVIVAELEPQKVGRTERDILHILTSTHTVSMRGPIMRAIRKEPRV